jgi:hypothetical protein
MVSGVATSTSSFVVFCDKTWYLQPSALVVKDGKPVLRGVNSQTDIRSTTSRSRYSWQVAIAVFKALYGDVICRCPYPLLSSVQFSVSGRRRTSQGRRTPICFYMLLVALRPVVCPLRFSFINIRYEILVGRLF